jgi:hypothetical protein
MEMCSDAKWRICLLEYASVTIEILCVFEP